MAKFGGSGNDMNPGEISRHLERQGSERGAYKVEVGSATPPGVKNSGAGAPKPSHSVDKPGV